MVAAHLIAQSARNGADAGNRLLRYWRIPGEFAVSTDSTGDMDLGHDAWYRRPGTTWPVAVRWQPMHSQQTFTIRDNGWRSEYAKRARGLLDPDDRGPVLMLHTYHDPGTGEYECVYIARTRDVIEVAGRAGTLVQVNGEDGHPFRVVRVDDVPFVSHSIWKGAQRDPRENDHRGRAGVWPGADQSESIRHVFRVPHPSSRTAP